MTSALSSAASSLTSLLRQSTIDDHEELLRAANAALKTSKSDLEAQHVKVVALLKLDRFEEALHTLSNGGVGLKDRARLEWAYALYKSGDPVQAAEIAQQGADRGSRHIEAQASYRTEDFKKAADLYETLASQKSDVAHEDVDLRINTSAVDAQLEWANLGHLARNKKPGRQDLDAFETAYNAACGSIARGELGQAEILLRRSRDLCNALDDLSEEDKHAELLPITVQQVYVLARLGRMEEAEKLASSIKPTELSDSTSKHIARINSIAASTQPANPFITQRLLQVTPQLFEPDKPFGYQRDVLQRNQYAVSLLSQKFGGTAASTKAVISSKSAPDVDATTNTLSVVNAAAHARNAVGKEALKALLPELEKRAHDLGLLLVVVQLYVLTGNNDTAILLMEKFLNRLSQTSDSSHLDVRYAPGLVGTLVSLYAARNQSGHIRSELAKAAKHWRHRSKSNSSASTPRSISHLLKAAGSVLLESEHDDDQRLASEIFSDLHKQDPNDRYASAGLVACLSSTSPEFIDSEQLKLLTSTQTLISGIDANALEEAGVVKTAPTITSTATKRPAPASTPRKAKKIKPSRMPKNYDANKKPDPERWLPLKDRSYYRPKGKKGKAKRDTLAQGAVMDETKDKGVSRPATPALQEKAGGGPGKGQQKKKKGKGGKW